MLKIIIKIGAVVRRLCVYAVSQASTPSMSSSFLTKWCCCMPLRIVCFILGYLSLAYNTLQALCLLFLVCIMGVETHGFDLVGTELPTTIEEAQEIQVTNQLLISQAKMLVPLCIANLTSLVVNIACLVGLHKKCPGPMKVYVCFASARLILVMTSLIFLVMSSVNYTQIQILMMSHGIDLALTGSCILVYYNYAKQLEREIEEPLQSNVINNSTWEIDLRSAAF